MRLSIGTVRVESVRLPSANAHAKHNVHAACGFDIDDGLQLQFQQQETGALERARDCLRCLGHPETSAVP